MRWHVDIADCLNPVTGSRMHNLPTKTVALLQALCQSFRGQFGCQISGRVVDGVETIISWQNAVCRTRHNVCEIGCQQLADGKGTAHRKMRSIVGVTWIGLSKLAVRIDPCCVPVEYMTIGVTGGKFSTLAIDPVRLCPFGAMRRPFTHATRQNGQKNDRLSSGQ